MGLIPETGTHKPVIMQEIPVLTIKKFKNNETALHKTP
jgi:hypothetical protein